MSPTVVVIGAGVSGMAAATRLAQYRPQPKVLVLEREHRIGGKAWSRRDGGFLFEAGPSTFIDTDGALDSFIAATGVVKLQANLEARRRFLFRARRLRELKPHPFGLWSQGILSLPGLCRLAAEPLIAARRDAADENVQEFARRRLGVQAAERLIAPLVLGIHAGDASRLSVAAAFPSLQQMEREHGSLVRGFLARRRPQRGGGPSGPAGVLTSFEGGLQELPLRAAEEGQFETWCGVEVESLASLAEGHWQISTRTASTPERRSVARRQCFDFSGADGRRIEADAVVCAGEAFSAAVLLAPIDAELANSLRSIPYSPVAVVALGFAPGTYPGVPHGFGTLVPRGETVRMLGCLWESRCFAGRAPEGHLLARCMFGGAVDPEVLLDSDARLIERADEEMCTMGMTTAQSMWRRVVRWEHAIPQYEVGHLSRVAEIEKRLQLFPTLTLASNYLHGIAYAKAATAGIAAAERVWSGLEGRAKRSGSREG